MIDIVVLIGNKYDDDEWIATISTTTTQRMAVYRQHLPRTGFSVGRTGCQAHQMMLRMVWTGQGGHCVVCMRNLSVLSDHLLYSHCLPVEHAPVTHYQQMTFTSLPRKKPALYDHLLLSWSSVVICWDIVSNGHLNLRTEGLFHPHYKMVQYNEVFKTSSEFTEHRDTDNCSQVARWQLQQTTFESKFKNITGAAGLKKTTVNCSTVLEQQPEMHDK